jgi:uncharacterized protein (DUF2336 family)
MSLAFPLIPELEQIVQSGSRNKRVETLQRITTLFLHSAGTYKDEHVDLFDRVFGLLIEEIETKARAELSIHLAPLTNAPAKVLRTLAYDDDIAVAGPVLKLAPRLAEADLVEVAKNKSQAHLHAISARRVLGEALTDVLVGRGDHVVARRVAENREARISATGFSRLVNRAADDGVLAETVGLRPDIPAPLFRELLTRATAVVHERLLAAATPERRTEIASVLTKVAREVGVRVGPRDYRAAQRVVLGLSRAGRMDESALATFCGDNKYDEAVVALASLAKVPINVVDRLMAGDRRDPILILCKAAGFAWPTVQSVFVLHPGGKASPGQGLEAAFGNYARLSSATARRVIRFWQLKRAS